MSWVYIDHVDGGFRTYTVGFYNPDGKWHSDSDHDSKADAGLRCNFLNGGPSDQRMQELRNAILEIAAALQAFPTVRR